MLFSLRNVILTVGILSLPYTQAQTLSFVEAQARLNEVSDALSSSQALVSNRQELAKASRSLHEPDVSLDFKYMRFSKTLDLSHYRDEAAVLPIPIVLPAEARELDWRVRPIITATLPLYTGGKIQAAKAASDAQLSEAQAELKNTQQEETVQLVQAYFGQLLAEQAVVVRQDVRDGLQQHFERASRLEAEGFATQAQKLQAKVAFDNAEREYRQALNDLQGAQAALSGLLRSNEVIQPSSPLFIMNEALPPAAEFTQAALVGHPKLQQIHSIIEQAQQKVAAEKSSWLPQVYLFGQYDLKKEDALITDSDWAFGVGMRYHLWSSQNRMRQVSAAKSQEQQASFSLQDSATKIAIAVERAWLRAENARQQYKLLESALDSADENLRLQNLSFQAGQATSLDVIDARLQQGKVRIERAQSAWQYDVALIQLLDISGQTYLFADYLKQAEQVMQP